MIVKVIVLSFFIAVLVLSYIGLLLEIKNLNKKNSNLDASLSAIKNKNTNLLAEKQILESEDRIITLAESNLTMIKNEEQVPVIELDQNHNEQIRKIINGKYE